MLSNRCPVLAIYISHHSNGIWESYQSTDNLYFWWYTCDTSGETPIYIVLDFLEPLGIYSSYHEVESLSCKWNIADHAFQERLDGTVQPDNKKCNEINIYKYIYLSNCSWVHWAILMNINVILMVISYLSHCCNREDNVLGVVSTCFTLCFDWLMLLFTKFIMNEDQQLNITFTVRVVRYSLNTHRYCMSCISWFLQKGYTGATLYYKRSCIQIIGIDRSDISHLSRVYGSMWRIDFLLTEYMRWSLKQPVEFLLLENNDTAISGSGQKTRNDHVVTCAVDHSINTVDICCCRNGNEMPNKILMWQNKRWL